MDATLGCRACRFIGNLSESQYYAEAFFNAGAIKILVPLLKAKVNTSTHLMNIRALRNIWSNCGKSRKEIIKLNSINSISSIFVKSASRISQKSHAELAEGCLKALCIFVKDDAIKCAKQMDETYTSIVELCKSGYQFAINCFCLLWKIAECRINLGQNGAIETLIDIITEKKVLTFDLAISLNMTCREAVNRRKLSETTGLEFILDLLKDTRHAKFHSILLQALVNFEYDENGILKMINYGLLEILTEKLKKMAISHKQQVEKNEKISNKRAGELRPAMDKRHYKTFKSSRYSMDYHHVNWSPKSSTSGYSSPPGTPPSMSLDLGEEDDSEEDNYSPVCSDDDDEMQEVESLQSCKSIQFEDSESLDGNSKLYTEEFGSQSALVLLATVSCLDGPIEKFADPATIDSLVDYIKCARNIKASRILSRILRNKVYLLPLIKQGFVFKVQTICNSDQYLQHLLSVAETGGAIGEMSSLLIKGEEHHKEITALSIPFILSCRKLLKTLMIDHNGLSIIIQILNNESHDLHKKAISSICKLAVRLELRAEMAEKYLQFPCDFREIQENNTTDYSMVTFELDDGTTVDTCKKTLCRISDPFSAMLEGRFSESGKRRVKLRNVSREGLQTLLLVANGVKFENRPIESMLDAVLIADRFLMAEIAETLTCSSISKLNWENFSVAWNWAKNNSCEDLSTCCVKSFLICEMSDTEREQAFRGFWVSEKFDEFLKEIDAVMGDSLC